MKHLTSADAVYKLIIVALGELRYVASVDIAICDEIYVHWRKDIKKLIDLHHPDDGVGIEKIVGYFAFWVRKLHPISLAFPVVKGPDGVINIQSDRPNKQINELISIFVIKLLLLEHFETKALAADGHTSGGGDIYRKMIGQVAITFSKLFATLQETAPFKSILRVFLYDMRYRTFGPHHLTHAVRYLMEDAGVSLAYVNSKHGGLVDLYRVNKLLHMRVFLSAPDDQQKSRISNGHIEELIRKNTKKWINTFGVVVTTLSMQDLGAARSNKSAQSEIFRQIKNKFDIYFGLIGSRFGTPVDGFGSGTEAEYEYAVGNLPGEFIIFGRDTSASDVAFGSLTQEQREQLSRVEDFFRKIGDKQLYCSWGKTDFDEKFIAQIESKIIEFKEISF